MDVWAADGRAGLTRTADGALQRVGEPGMALCACGGRVYCAGAEACAVYDAHGKRLYAFAVPGGVARLRCFCGMICALSADAESVTGYSLRNGSIVFSAPVGRWPRGMAVSADGGMLAVAGGEGVTMLDAALRRLARFALPGPAADVCFLQRGLAALCADREDFSSGRLFMLSPQGVAEEIAAFPYAPACLCGLPGGHCLVGCEGQVMGFRSGGGLFFRRSCGYPAVIRACRGGVLICDSLRGEARLLDGRLLCRGGDLRDALIAP